MRKLTMAVLAALGPALALAQGGPRRGPPPDRIYDPATVTTVTGTVVTEQRHDRGRGHAGVHLVLDTGSAKVTVHLGPDFFVDAQRLHPVAGDQVTVKGSSVVLDGQPALIAQVVTRGAEVLVLRDESGKPRWSGPPGQK